MPYIVEDNVLHVFLIEENVWTVLLLLFFDKHASWVGLWLIIAMLWHVGISKLMNNYKYI